MSAAVYGANLLNEVVEESLDDLLSDLRYSVSPNPRSLLGIPELDRIVEAVRYPDLTNNGPNTDGWTSPSRADDDSPHLRRVRPRLNLQHDDESEDSLAIISVTKPPPVLIEIGATTSVTTRTELLYHIAATFVLPRLYKGKEAAIVWLDTSVSFSAICLHKSIVHILESKLPIDPAQLLTLPVPEALAPSSIQQIAFDALKHVHVYSVSSSSQLMSILTNLPSYLLNITAQQDHNSYHRPLGLIILDSATSFQHKDRFDAEIARLENRHATNPTGPLQATVTNNAQRAIATLKSLANKFDCTCIYTTDTPNTNRVQKRQRSHHNNPPPPQDSSSPQPPPPLPDIAPPPFSMSPYTLAATLSLSLTRIPVPQFASHMSLADCLRDRDKRQEIVARNRWWVGVQNAVALSTTIATPRRGTGAGGREEEEEEEEEERKERKRLEREIGRMGFVVRMVEGGGVVVE